MQGRVVQEFEPLSNSGINKSMDSHSRINRSAVTDLDWNRQYGEKK